MQRDIFMLGFWLRMTVMNLPVAPHLQGQIREDLNVTDKERCNHSVESTQSTPWSQIAHQYCTDCGIATDTSKYQLTQCLQLKDRPKTMRIQLILTSIDKFDNAFGVRSSTEVLQGSRLHPASRRARR